MGIQINPTDISIYIALASLLVSVIALNKDKYKLIFEVYYTYEYGGQTDDYPDDKYDGIKLVIRNIGTKTCYIENAGVLVSKSLEEIKKGDIPKILPSGYSGLDYYDFAEITDVYPLKIEGNEEKILHISLLYGGGSEREEYLRNILKKLNHYGIISVLDSNGKKYNVFLRPQNKLKWVV